MAICNGAECETTFTDRVTHVISKHANTSSVAKAKANKIHAVSLRWLTDSVAHWKWMPEELYAL